MGCDCIRKLQQKLREDTGDSGASVAVAFVFSAHGVDGHVTIPVVRRVDEAGGSPGCVLDVGGFFGGYCPICGKEMV
jgi:hypothetical protein